RRVAFSWTSERPCSITADRRSFIGRNGNLAEPAAMSQTVLSGEVGAGLDPCAALHGRYVLEPGERRRLLFLLGEGSDRDDARRLIAGHGHIVAALAAQERVAASWDDMPDAVQVRTPADS